MGVFKPLTGSALLLALIAAQAQAAIITPVSVTPSSEFAAAANLINGSGLSGVGPVETQLHDNNENNMWQTFNLGSGTSIGETAIFTFDQAYDLSNVHIWQYNGLNGFGLEELDRELDEIAIAVSPDLVSPFVPFGNINMAPALDQTAAGFNEPAQVFSLASSAVRRVQFTILSVQGGLDDGTAGLSEVRFEGVAIPEPASLALAAVGLVSIPWLARRKRT